MARKFETSPYQKKIAELHQQIEEKAKELQAVIEERDSSLREVRELGERKGRILGQLGKIEEKIGQAEVHLKETIEAIVMRSGVCYERL